MLQVTGVLLPIHFLGSSFTGQPAFSLSLLHGVTQSPRMTNNVNDAPAGDDGGEQQEEVTAGPSDNVGAENTGGKPFVSQTRYEFSFGRFLVLIVL